nr:MAG TPA: hypothetical protein [Caudoviricetes sp.]
MSYITPPFSEILYMIYFANVVEIRRKSQLFVSPFLFI